MLLESKIYELSNDIHFIIYILYYVDQIYDLEIHFFDNWCFYSKQVITPGLCITKMHISIQV
jgi:hypothetical protein